MKTQEIITVSFPEVVKKSKSHRFQLNIVNDKFISGKDVEQQYPFTSNKKRIAIVKSSLLNTIIIITGGFNVRYSNWKSIEDAEYNLSFDDVVANCVTIDDKKEYIIAREHDVIDNVRFNLINISHLGDEPNNIITASFNKIVRGSKKHLFKLDLSSDYFNTNNIYNTYPFNRDFDKIAIVKSSLYPKVLLISSMFKLMLTNWDTILEARHYINKNDLLAYYAKIGEDSVCLIADSSEEIENIKLQIPEITVVSQDTRSHSTSHPLCIEQNTRYAHIVSRLNQPTFSDIREISVNVVRNYPIRRRDAIFNAIEHGEAILDNEEQLHVYMYCFGQMHEAKLRKAFQNIPDTVLCDDQAVDIIDYGCGQGIASICFNDFLEEEYPFINVEKITLIDPSPVALSRAALLCNKIFPSSSLETIQIDFDNLKYKMITKSSNKRIHLFSNILDMTNFDLRHLAILLKRVVKKADLFVCVSPWYHDKKRDGRQRRLKWLLNGNQIYNDVFNKMQLVPDKTWTAIITIFEI